MRRTAHLLRAVLLLLLFVFAGTAGLGPGLHPASAQAQGSATAALTQEDYDAWETEANRAEDSIGADAASDAAFEELRAQLVDWRTRFEQAQLANADRIRTLQSQIDALGPAPAEGETESEEIATRRSQLNDQYRQLVTPVRKAEEAFTRANGLIAQIDHLLRNRQKEKLLQRGPTPLKPGNIAIALSDLETVWRILYAEVSSSARLQTDRAKLAENMPVIVLLAVIAAVLLLRGRKWFKRIVDWVVRRGRGTNQAYVMAMVVSLGQVIVPAIGLIALTVALLLTSMFGPNGEGLLGVVPRMGLAILMTHWLGGLTFPRDDKWPGMLELTARERVRGRFYASSFGYLLAAAVVAIEIDRLFPLERATVVAIGLPIIALSSLCLGGMSRLFISYGRRSAGDSETSLSFSDGEVGDERSLGDRLLLLIGRVFLVMAYIAPFLALVGYTRAAIFFSLSPALTLFLIMLVNYLQRLATGIYQLVAGPGADPKVGLLPVLMNFSLAVLALPSLAMIWGVRGTDLQEIWARLMRGISIGETTISPAALAYFFIAFGIGYIVTRIVQAAMRTSVLPRTHIDVGGQKAVISGLGYLGIFLSAMIAVSVAGLDLSSLALVASALTVGIGFGLQNIVSNFVSGLILIIERPMTEGDWIEVGGVMGTVQKISVRATTIETFDRTRVIVPNSDFVSGQVTNWTRGSLSGRLILSVGVAYGTDTRKVAAILQEIAEAHPMVIVNPPPSVVFQGFGADSLDFEMRVILRDINFGLGTRTELNHQIVERFAAEGIEIPYAQRDIWLRNPEALRPSVPGRHTDPPGPVKPESETPPAAPRPDSEPYLVIDQPDDAGGEDGR